MLRDILLTETDENHELGISEIMDKLKLTFGTDYKVDHRAIKRDFEALNLANFEINENTGTQGKILYSHQARLFETYQIRLLADAVLSARFITEEEKKQLITKLKKLTSTYIAKTLPDPMIYQQSINIDYKLIKVHIDQIHTAISQQRPITFQYGKYNVEKEFVYNRDGDRYEVRPYALIWQNDFYYLIGEYVKYNQFRHYRLDRMRNVEVLETRFKKKEFNSSEYVGRSFHMYAGEEQWLKIEFHNDLINVVIDRFGLEADIKPVDASHFVLTTKAKVSEGLLKWILTWGSQAKVLAPTSIVDELKEEIEKMVDIYR